MPWQDLPLPSMKMVYIVVISNNNRDNPGIFVVTDSNNNYSDSSNM